MEKLEIVLVKSIQETALKIANDDQYHSFTRFVRTKADSTSHRQNSQTLEQEVYKFINLPLQLLIHFMFVKTVIICGTFNN